MEPGAAPESERPTLPELPRMGEALAPPAPPALALEAEPPPPSRKAEPASASRGAHRSASRRPASPSGASPQASRAPASAEAEPPPGALSERLATARRLITEDNLGEARAILERLVALGVATAPVYSQLGAIYMAQEFADRALECFEQALAREPMDLMARVCRGEARLWRGELRLAQEDLQRVLDAGTAGSPLVQRAQQLLQRIEERRDRRR